MVPGNMEKYIYILFLSRFFQGGGGYREDNIIRIKAHVRLINLI